MNIINWWWDQKESLWNLQSLNLPLKNRIVASYRYLMAMFCWWILVLTWVGGVTLAVTNFLPFTQPFCSWCIGTEKLRDYQFIFMALEWRKRRSEWGAFSFGSGRLSSWTVAPGTEELHHHTSEYKRHFRSHQVWEYRSRGKGSRKETMSIWPLRPIPMLAIWCQERSVW